MRIINSSEEDLPFIFELFGKAIDYQKSKGYDLWPNFSEDLIRVEIKEKRHWKIIESDKVYCFFSVLYNDPIIWGEQKDKDPAVYLHRIVVNPEFKGRQLMKVIHTWAIEHALEKQKRFVRMDTWGNNENLRNYYIRCGFHYIGQQHLKQTPGLPSHYGGSVLSLFETAIII